MATLRVRAPIVMPLVGFGRVVLFFSAIFEVIVDAQRDASAAHKRYPFAEW